MSSLKSRTRRKIIGVRVIRTCAVWGVVMVAGCGRFGYQDPPANEAPVGLDAGVGTNMATLLECSEGSAVGLAGFKAEAIAANSVHWHWVRANGAMNEYRIGVTTSRSELEEGRAIWLAPAELPALGDEWVINHFGDNWVATNGLAAGTRYFAQLVALADDGCTRSEIAEAVTLPAPTRGAVAWSESEPPGFSIPDDFVFSTTSPFQGAGHYSFVSDCQPQCFDVLRRASMDLDVSDMNPDDFANAIVEFSVQVVGGDHISWGVLQFAPSGDAQVRSFEPLHVKADGSYRTYQLPLSVLKVGDQRIAFEDLAAGIDTIGVGGSWSMGATVNIDEVRVRW